MQGFQLPRSQLWSHQGNFRQDRLRGPTQVQRFTGPLSQGPPIILSLPVAPLPRVWLPGLGSRVYPHLATGTQVLPEPWFLWTLPPRRVIMGMK